MQCIINRVNVPLHTKGDIRFRNPDSGTWWGCAYRVNFVHVYTKVVCIKSPKCHVVLLADVVVYYF